MSRKYAQNGLEGLFKNRGKEGKAEEGKAEKRERRKKRERNIEIIKE